MNINIPTPPALPSLHSNSSLSSETNINRLQL